MADENDDVKKSSDGKGLLITLMILILILIMAVAGGTYLLFEKISNNSSSAAPVNNSTNTSKAIEEGTPQASTTAPTGVDGNYKADMNDLILNLTDSKGKEKVMKLSFSIKSNESSISSLVEQYKPEITDIVISQVGARSSEELLTVGGKNSLKNDLTSEINNVLSYVTKLNTNFVSTILFTSFVIK